MIVTNVLIDSESCEGVDLKSLADALYHEELLVCVRMMIVVWLDRFSVVYEEVHPSTQ